MVTSKRAAAAAAVIGLLALLSGCGWTSRDAYLDRHQGSVQPRPGDGSILSARHDDPFRAQAGKVAARRADGLDR